MGLYHSLEANAYKERNSFRDCIIEGLQKSELILDKERKGMNDLALVMRPFEMPVDISYAVKSMYHGYPYHLGILYDGLVYNYMPDIDKLLTMKLGQGIHIDTLHEFMKYGPTEIYYIHNTGIKRAEIIARLVELVHIKRGLNTLKNFNKINGITLGEYYNLFLNNCEHFANTVLVGLNFSCQAELIYPDLSSYKSNLLKYKSSMPEYGQIWLKEYYDIMT